MEKLQTLTQYTVPDVTCCKLTDYGVKWWEVRSILTYADV